MINATELQSIKVIFPTTDVDFEEVVSTRARSFALAGASSAVVEVDQTYEERAIEVLEENGFSDVYIKHRNVDTLSSVISFTWAIG